MICVTGATGLVGSHLVYRLLISGFRVRATRRRSSNTETIKRVFAYYSPDYLALFDQIEWIEADLSEPVSLDRALAGCEYVYHAAAMVSFAPSHKSIMYKINVEGTANIVNACLHHNVKKLCYVSSIAALGGSVNSSLISEETKWTEKADISNYSISKFYAENEVWKGIRQGLNTVIVNPTVILGPGNWESGSSALFHTVWKGLKFYTEGITGFVDVRDVAEIMTRLMESDISGEKYILNAENVCYRDLFVMMANAMIKTTPKIRVTKLLAEVAWRLESIRSFVLRKQALVTKETARSARKINFYSNKKICAALNYTFIPVDDSVKFISGLLLQEKKKTGL